MSHPNVLTVPEDLIAIVEMKPLLSVGRCLGKRNTLDILKVSVKNHKTEAVGAAFLVRLNLGAHWRLAGDVGSACRKEERKLQTCTGKPGKKVATKKNRNCFLWPLRSGPSLGSVFW